MAFSRPARSLLIVIASFVAWSCSGDSPAAKPLPPPLAKPNSPQEAIERLNETQKKSFETWRRAILKSCDPADVFALSMKPVDEPILGADLRALLESNEASLLLRGEDGTFAVVDQGDKILESATATADVDGVQAAATVADDTCSITLHGQKIFEGPFHETLNIIAFADGTAPPAVSPGRMGMQGTADPGLVRLTGGNFGSALRAVFEPEEERAVAWVSQRLALAHPKLRELVRAKPRRRPHLSFRLEFNRDSYWFDENETRPLESAAVARKFLEKAPSVARVFAVWELPERNFGGVRNVKDRGPHWFETRVTARAESTVTAPWRETTDGIDGEKELTRCLVTRAGWLARAEPSPSPENQVKPSLEATADPCHVLFTESWKKWDAENVWSSVLPLVLARIVASPRANYGGWEHPVFRLVTGLFDKGVNPATTLDPQGKSPFLAGFVARLGELRTRLAVDEYRPLFERRAAYDRMVATWAFEGRTVGTARLDLILRSTARVMPVFPASTTTLVNALGNAPESLDDELEFAAGLGDDYLSLATQVAWRAEALDCGWFQAKVLDLLIQKKVPRSELEKWNVWFGKIGGWSLKYSRLRARQGAVGHIAAELLERGRTDAEVEKTLGALANAIEPFDDSTHALIETLEQEPAGSIDELVFASELTAEYKAKAVEVRRLGIAVGLAAWTADFWRTILQRRPSASQLDEMNRALLAGEKFTAREKARLMDRRENAQDRRRIDFIVKAIEESWSDAEFIVIEAVAPIATFKEICNHRSVFRTISARADCLGLENFSAGTRKILWSGFMGRYGVFAEKARIELELHAPSEILRPEFVNLFFQRDEPVWSQCADAEFNTKSARFFELLIALRTEPDPRKREPLRNAFRENLRTCR